MGAMKLPQLQAIKTQGSSGSLLLRTRVAVSVTPTAWDTALASQSREGLALFLVAGFDNWAVVLSLCNSSSSAREGKATSIGLTIVPPPGEMLHLHSLS